MNKQYISGYGQISNLGLNANEALNKLLQPSDDFVLRHASSPEDPDVYIGHKIELPNTDHIKASTSYPLSRSNKMLILCVEEALERAGLTANDLKGRKVGICLGSTTDCLTCDMDFGKVYYSEQAEDFSSFTHSSKNNATTTLSSYYQTDGPILLINNACTSGTDVIGIASSWIRQGLCDMALVGGIDSAVEHIYAGFRSLGLVSQDSTKPFDKNRDGLAIGEGAGVVIVESDESLKQRQTKAYCEVLGYGLSIDSYHPTSPHPEAKGLALAVDQALRGAGLKKDSVDLINAHATGTKTNDRTEGQYLFSHFKDTPIFATKAYTGHTLGAAGTLEAIWGILCFQENFIPASHGHSDVDPEIQLVPNLKVKDHKANIYLSTSLGFGGSNSALLLGRCNE